MEDSRTKQRTIDSQGHGTPTKPYKYLAVSDIAPLINGKTLFQGLSNLGKIAESLGATSATELQNVTLGY